jgi:hypothetical protein
VTTLETVMGPEGPHAPTTMVMTQGGRAAPARRRSAVLAGVLWALAMLCLAAIAWFDQLLRQAGRPDLVQPNASAIPYLLGVFSATTVGAVVASRRPRHPVGWLLVAWGCRWPSTA